MISHSTAKPMSENITTDPAALNSFAMATTQESSSQVFVTCTISNVHPSAGSEARTQGTVRDLLVNGLDRTAKVTKIHELSEPITAQGYASRHCDEEIYGDEYAISTKRPFSWIGPCRRGNSTLAGHRF